MATGTNAIATEQEVTNITGYSGGITTNLCCTKSRAITLGADELDLSNYIDNLLVKYSDIKKKSTTPVEPETATIYFAFVGGLPLQDYTNKEGTVKTKPLRVGSFNYSITDKPYKFVGYVSNHSETFGTFETNGSSSTLYSDQQVVWGENHTLDVDTFDGHNYFIITSLNTISSINQSSYVNFNAETTPKQFEFKVVNGATRAGTGLEFETNYNILKPTVEIEIQDANGNKIINFGEETKDIYGANFYYFMEDLTHSSLSEENKSADYLHYFKDDKGLGISPGKSYIIWIFLSDTFAQKVFGETIYLAVMDRDNYL